MRKSMLLLAAALLAVVSCSKEELVSVDEVINGQEPSPEAVRDAVKSVVFSLPEIGYVADEADTRAGVKRAETSTGFIWEAADTVGIYPDSGSQIYWSMEKGAGTNTATFNGGAWALKPSSSYMCYYPFIPDYYLRRDRIPASFLGQVQHGTDSFTGARFFLVADGTTTEDGSLRFDFSVLNTIIEVIATLPPGTYTKISITAPEDLFVSEGTYSIDSREITGGKFSNTLSIDLKDVTLESIETIHIYLMSAPVDLKDKQVVVSANKSGVDVLTCEKTPSKTYAAGTRYGLTCDFTTPDDRYISFADPAVKAICVENWDTDKDGELSYVEAAAVTTVPYGVFSNNREITSFDEFQYFTGVTKLEYDSDYDEGCEYYGAFSGSSLKSIKIPSSLKTISFGAFSGCASLEEITIPSTVTSIGMSAFHSCPGLTVHMESATPCSMFRDAYGTWDEPYAFGYQYMGGTVKAIYVPDEAAETAYKSAQYWSTYSSIIHPEGWVDPSQNIVFEDENTKTICVTLWDTNMDGELSYSEAAAVTDFSSFTALSSTAITSFNEMKYFTGLTSLPANAFYNYTNLEELSFSSNLESIGANAFYGCTKLKKIAVPSIETWFDVVSPSAPFSNPGELYVNDQIVTEIIIPDGNNEVAPNLCKNLYKLTSVEIPSSVSTIGYGAFYGCSGLTSISIPEGVTSIGTYTFYGCCGLTNVIIPEGVARIGDNSFRGCSGLNSIIIPEGVIYIGSHAFQGCTGITSIILPDGVIRIGNQAFRGCSNITSINIPEGLTTIGGLAFYGCSNLKEIVLPSSVTDIVERYGTSGGYYNGAFYGSGIEKITCYLPLLEVFNGVGSKLYNACYETYGTVGSFNKQEVPPVKQIIVKKDIDVVFYDLPVYAFGLFDYLESVQLPSGMTGIGKLAFVHSGIKEFTIPNTVKSVGISAFERCSNLKSISIPEGVTSIGLAAFSKCSGLQALTVWATTPPTLGMGPYGNDALYGTNNCPIYVPAGTVASYKSADGWSAYADRIQTIPSQVVDLEGISLASSIILANGSNASLTPTFTPSSATNTEVTWSSSNTSVATVDDQGNVSAVGNGTATITVTAEDGGFEATCEVTVNNSGRPFPKLVPSTRMRILPMWPTIKGGSTLAPMRHTSMTRISVEDLGQEWR